MSDMLNDIPSCITLHIWWAMTTAPMATSTTSAAAVLFVICFAYRNYTRHCRMNIKGAGSTASNFLRYLKTHLDGSATW